MKDIEGEGLSLIAEPDQSIDRNAFLCDESVLYLNESFKLEADVPSVKEQKKSHWWSSWNRFKRSIDPHQKHSQIQFNATHNQAKGSSKRYSIANEKILLTQRGQCLFQEKVEVAHRANAKAVLIANTEVMIAC